MADSIWDTIAKTLLLGKFRAAMQAAAEVVQRARTPGDEAEIPLESALDLLARFHVCQGAYDKALPLHQEGLSVAERRFGDMSEEFAWFASRLACDLMNLGQIDEAASCCARETAIIEGLGGENHPHYWRALSNLADVCIQRGDFAAAEDLRVRSLRLRIEQHGNRSCIAACGLSALAGSYRRAGGWRPAMKALEQVVSIYARNSWRGDALHWRFFAEALRNLGSVYEHIGEIAAARDHFAKSVKVFREFLDAEEHPAVRDARDRLNKVL